MGRHLLQPGETFFSVTNRMTKNRHGQCRWNADLSGPLITYEVLRPGMRRYFEKGKRKYLCEVIGLVETKTGLFLGSIPKITLPPSVRPEAVTGVRYWQFTYLVMVVEN